MPLCEVGKYQNGGDANCNNGTKIFYTTYGQGPVKVLFIIGLAGTHSSWDPQIKALAGTIKPNDAESPAGDRSSGEGGGMEVCAFDNRGMGLSSVPTKKSEYTTSIMAKDAIAVMDHLGWEKAHVFGHSMGAMIACKLAAMVPERVLTLALLNVTGGGYECIPRLDRKTLSIAVRFLKAKTPEQRAAEMSQIFLCSLCSFIIDPACLIFYFSIGEKKNRFSRRETCFSSLFLGEV